MHSIEDQITELHAYAKQENLNIVDELVEKQSAKIPGHSYVIVDKEGVVKFVRDDIQMAVRNQELAVEIDKL